MKVAEHNLSLIGRISLVALLIFLFVVRIHTCSYSSPQKCFFASTKAVTLLSLSGLMGSRNGNNVNSSSLNTCF